MADAELVTILFTDVEGSTSLLSARGDVEAQSILRMCDELARDQVAGHGGRAIKSLGDGLMASFPSPLRAVACALAIQSGLAERGRRRAREHVRLRIGVHTGMASYEDGDLFGAAVNAAARISARAKGGEVLVSDVVRQLWGSTPGATFEDRGRVALKGFPERWRVYSVASTEAPSKIAGAVELTPFVGRELEKAELRRLMERALAGQGGVVMVGGEPGVGKTRLCREIAQEGRQSGFRALTGHCYEREGDIAYMPWVEMMEQVAAGASPTALMDALGDTAPEMARLVPELRRLLPDIPAPIELPADQQRRYTFNSIGDYIIRVARLQPRLYVLEDLHWADESTLLLLEYLAERLMTSPVLILGTYRDPPLDISPALERTLVTLVRHRHTRILGLKHHPPADVAEMLRVLSGQPPPAPVAEAIYAETEGNAFFVEEVFRHLAETGVLMDEEGRYRADLRVGELDVPRNVRLVTAQRLERLTEATRRMLTMAAIIGRRFSFELLEDVSGLDEDALLDAVDEAELARLVHADAVSQGSFWFNHELIRQTLLAQLSAPRRQRHHLRVADAIERRHIEARAAEIAHHLVAAGPAAGGERTARYLTLAGDRALAAVAFEDALRDYAQALSVLPADQGRQRADVLLRVGLAQRGLRRWDETVATWHEALGILEDLGEVDAVITLCWDFAFQLVWANRFSEAQAVAERGLSISGDRRSSRARLLGMRALGLGEAGRFDEATAVIAEARRIADSLPDDRLGAEVSLCETVHHYLFMQLPQLMEAGRRAAAGLRREAVPWHVADALTFLDVAYVFQGHLAESDALHVELEPLAHEVGHLGAQVIARRNRFPKLAAQRADLSELEALSVTQADAVHTMGDHWVAYAHTQRGVLHVWQGDWTRARAEMEAGVRLAFPGFWYGIHHGFLFLLLAMSGDRTGALAVLDGVAEALPTPRTGNGIGAWSLASLAAEGVGVLGEAERADPLYRLVAEDLANGTVLRQYDGALLHRAAGMAAATAGLLEEAEEHFSTALRLADEMPHMMERPQVKYWYGRFLGERGTPDDLSRAHLLLDDAVTEYASIGMERHRAMSEQLLAELR